ncbi:MAG: alpha/beta fold hydrolase [Desulfuromonas sp.]|nr:alpha/beta fold hydrolase [Desulfuromonas sp.]
MSNFYPHIIITLVVITVLTAITALFVICQRQAVRLTSSSPTNRQQYAIDHPENSPELLLQQHKLDAQPIELTTSDGLHLFALYAPSTNGATIILSHGYKMSCSEMIPIAALLARQGYGVLLPDQRSHGRSDGNTISFGYHEWRDLEAAVNFLVEQNPHDKIGIFGNSMGGALAVVYAAREPLIAAVIAQSPYASVGHSINKGVSKFSGLPAFPFAPLIHYLAQRRLGIDTAKVAPVNTIAAIAPRPIMLLMGGSDQTVEAEGIFVLQQAAGANCSLWFEPELDHVEFYQRKPEEFAHRIVGFYNHALLSKNPVSH